MLQIRFESPNNVRLVEVEDEPIRDDRILVKSIYTGISIGTELHWLSGSFDFEYPGCPGYLGIGEVVAVGCQVRRPDIQVGDVVWAGQCHSSMWNQFPGVVQRLPDGANLKEATLLHLAAIGLHSLRRGKAKPGELLLVAGQGLLGQLTAQVGRILGCSVVTTDVSELRVMMSSRYSADYAFKNDSPEFAALCESRGGFDIIVDAAGADGLADELIRHMKPHGRLVVQAVTPRVSIEYPPAHKKEISAVFCCDATGEEDMEVIRMLESRSLTIEPLITDVLEPSEAPAFYQALLNDPVGRDHTLGAIINWRGRN